MARRLNMVFLAAIAIAVLVQNSAAQTTHTVGDSTGWTIPPSGSSFNYPSWVANKSIGVGDILVFNFPNGAHDVATVTKADYDACTSTNPISVVTTTPARITLNTSGEHYFICNFPGHCSAGQKLMVNVRAATSPSPAPQPSSPAPQSSSPSPTPVPSSAPQPSSPSPTPVPFPAPGPSSPTPQPSSPSPTPVPSSPGPSTPPSSGPSPPSPPPTATPPTTSSPSPSSTTPPPPGVTAPPPSSATSLGVTGLFTSFLTFFVALLY